MARNSYYKYHNKDIGKFLEDCKKAPALGPNQTFKSEKLNGERPDPISETKPKPSESLWGGDFLEVPNECALAEGIEVHGEYVSNEQPEWHRKAEWKHISVTRSDNTPIDEEEPTSERAERTKKQAAQSPPIQGDDYFFV
jgi:hypothetical protein